jgi:hypothetical protein
MFVDLLNGRHRVATMTALILALALTFRPSLPHVDVCEINTTPTIRQVILYRWTWLPSGQFASCRTVVVDRQRPKVKRIGDRWLVISEGRRFTCRTLHRTETQHDPEVLDRRKLNEADRIEYIK